MALALSELINPDLIAKMDNVAKDFKSVKSHIKPLDTKIVKLTAHAEKRAKERFGLEPKDAEKHFRDLLKRATFVSEVSCEESGERSLLYGVRDGVHAVCIHLTLDNLNILTVYKTKNITCGDVKSVHDEIHALYHTKLRKAQRKERALLKKKPLLEIDAYAQIYASKLVIMKTTSKKKIEKEKEIISKNESIILENNKEVEEIQSVVRQMARAIIGMM